VTLSFSKKLFGKSEPSGPRGHRAYVVGYIHGRLDLLEELLSQICSDIRQRPMRKTSLVFLGDLIDRGPSSAQVVERLRTLEMPEAQTAFIMGNHEEVLLRVLEGEADLIDSWFKFGGKETLQSYGVDPRRIKALPDEEAIAAIATAVPKSHVRFISGFADTVSFGDYLLVHAGIRPGIELSQQSQSDLRWIRSPFLEHEGEHGFVVVHGHTITSEVEIAPNRIGIDTGAYDSGVLTALALEGTRRWLLQTAD
jgi:serine/threonine protein phosphatase 1